MSGSTTAPNWLVAVIGGVVAVLLSLAITGAFITTSSLAAYGIQIAVLTKNVDHLTTVAEHLTEVTSGLNILSGQGDTITSQKLSILAGTVVNLSHQQDEIQKQLTELNRYLNRKGTP